MDTNNVHPQIQQPRNTNIIYISTFLYLCFSTRQTHCTHFSSRQHSSSGKHYQTRIPSAQSLSDTLRRNARCLSCHSSITHRQCNHTTHQNEIQKEENDSLPKVILVDNEIKKNDDNDNDSLPKVILVENVQVNDHNNDNGDNDQVRCRNLLNIMIMIMPTKKWNCQT
mmetsp:Transcript_32744/g.49474  ORF Transcript_32744/g.49474 Transcript_32744/m.49474 type:complete len:168 (+) Transcript_32744:285-788(+)